MMDGAISTSQVTGPSARPWQAGRARHDARQVVSDGSFPLALPRTARGVGRGFGDEIGQASRLTNACGQDACKSYNLPKSLGPRNERARNGGFLSPKFLAY